MGEDVCPACGAVLEPKMVFEDLVLDLSAHRVFRGDKRINLTNREFETLEYLMRNRGRIVNRTQLINRGWHIATEEILTNQVDVYISYLRRKIDDGFPVKLIHTVRFLGYMFGLVDQIP